MSNDLVRVNLCEKKEMNWIANLVLGRYLQLMSLVLSGGFQLRCISPAPPPPRSGSGHMSFVCATLVLVCAENPVVSAAPLPEILGAAFWGGWRNVSPPIRPTEFKMVSFVCATLVLVCAGDLVVSAAPLPQILWITFGGAGEMVFKKGVKMQLEQIKYMESLVLR